MRFERHSDYLHTHHSQSATKENKQVEQTKPRIDTHCLVLDSLSLSLFDNRFFSSVERRRKNPNSCIVHIFLLSGILSLDFIFLLYTIVCLMAKNRWVVWWSPNVVMNVVSYFDYSMTKSTMDNDRNFETSKKNKNSKFNVQQSK